MKNRRKKITRDNPDIRYIGGSLENKTTRWKSAVNIDGVWMSEMSQQRPEK